MHGSDNKKVHVSHRSTISSIALSLSEYAVKTMSMYAGRRSWSWLWHLVPRRSFSTVKLSPLVACFAIINHRLVFIRAECAAVVGARPVTHWPCSPVVISGCRRCRRCRLWSAYSRLCTTVVTCFLCIPLPPHTCWPSCSLEIPVTQTMLRH